LKKDSLMFEYDINKSNSNKEKHGISFEEAKELWNKDTGIVIPAKIVDNEVRYALISKLNTKCYVAIFIKRDDNYRIISVRRCRKNEEKIYEKDNS